MQATEFYSTINKTVYLCLGCNSSFSELSPSRCIGCDLMPICGNVSVDLTAGFTMTKYPASSRYNVRVSPDEIACLVRYNGSRPLSTCLSLDLSFPYFPSYPLNRPLVIGLSVFAVVLLFVAPAIFGCVVHWKEKKQQREEEAQRHPEESVVRISGIPSEQDGDGDVTNTLQRIPSKGKLQPPQSTRRRRLVFF